MFEKLVTVEEIYDGFWKDILENEDGTIDIEQLKKELSDFYICMDNVPQVYCEITRNTLSKANYPARTVLNLFEEYFVDKAMLYDDLMEIIDDEKADDEEKVKWTKEYIESFKGA